MKKFPEQLKVLLFSYNDGIIQVDYTERAPPSYAIVSSDDGTQVKAEYGNAPLGNVGIKLGETFSSRAEAKERGLAEILLKQNDTKEIQLKASKGFYCDLGQIIRLEVPDSNLIGQYRITEKNISYSSSEVSCTFTLNKKPIRISDFI